MSEEQLKAFLEKVKSDTELQEKLKRQPPLKLLLKSRKTQALQLPQKIFNQCNRKKCQTRSWKTQLAEFFHAYAHDCFSL